MARELPSLIVTAGTPLTREQAIEHLVMQVTPDNVLAAHRAFQNHADELGDYLKRARRNMNFGPCGGDPVSADTMKSNSFAGKIDQLMKVHQDQQEELEAAANRLAEVARSYGYTDDDIARAMNAKQRT